MLIPSNMKSTVNISECQNLTEPSRGMKDARPFQHCYGYHLLILFTLLVLLVGGIVGYFTIWITRVTHHENVTFGLNWTFNISGEEKAHVFTAVNNGTYFIYGILQKNEAATKCHDKVRLVWKTSTGTESYAEEKMFSKNMKIHVANIKALNVRLDEKSKVHLQINCNYIQIEAEFRVLYTPEY